MKVSANFFSVHAHCCMFIFLCCRDNRLTRTMNIWMRRFAKRSPWHCSTIYLLRDLFICKTFSMQKKIPTKRNDDKEQWKTKKKHATHQQKNKKNYMKKYQRNIVGAMAKAWRTRKEGRRKTKSQKKECTLRLSTRKTNTERKKNSKITAKTKTRMTTTGDNIIVGSRM